MKIEITVLNKKGRKVTVHTTEYADMKCVVRGALPNGDMQIVIQKMDDLDRQMYEQRTKNMKRKRK